MPRRQDASSPGTLSASRQCLASAATHRSVAACCCRPRRSRSAGQWRTRSWPGSGYATRQPANPIRPPAGPCRRAVAALPIALSTRSPSGCYKLNAVHPPATSRPGGSIGHGLAAESFLLACFPHGLPTVSCRRACIDPGPQFIDGPAHGAAEAHRHGTQAAGRVHCPKVSLGNAEQFGDFSGRDGQSP